VIDSIRAFALFAVTAAAEIGGCYFVYLWLRKQASPWLLLPAAASLALFAFLLTLHPAAAGRTYAAYGCVYIAAALTWLWAIEGIRPTPWDAAGVALALAGMTIIVLQPAR
jgi:small multidrug resistance family-3 protein